MVGLGGLEPPTSPLSGLVRLARTVAVPGAPWGPAGPIGPAVQSQPFRLRRQTRSQEVQCRINGSWHARRAGIRTLRKTAERNEILIREGLWVDAGDEFQGILVIDFFKDLVRELEAIDAPESVALAVVLEVFVAGFQSAEIPFVFIHIVDVFAHQHTILIFD